MPEYLSPGVYVEEINVGPVPIEGVSTSTAGFVGMAAQGPIGGLPVLVTSFSEYKRIFGGYLSSDYEPANEPNKMAFLPYAVQGFFDNGGQRVYIARVAPKTGGPTEAQSQNLKGGLITRLSKDVTAGSKLIQLSTTRGIQADTTPPAASQPTPPPAASQPTPPPPASQPTPPPAGGTTPPARSQTTTATPHAATTLTFTQVKDGIAKSEQVVVSSYDDISKTVTLKTGLQNSYQARYTTVETDRTGNSPFTINALNGGAWGNSLAIQVFQTSVARSPVKSILSDHLDTVELYSAANFYPGAIVEFNLGKTKIYRKIKNDNGVNGRTIILTQPFSDTNGLKSDSDDPKFVPIASTCEFRLTVANSSFAEDYPTLTLDPATPYYIKTQIDNQSSLISVTGQDNTSTDPFTMPSASDGLNVTMAKGVDSSGTVQFDARDYTGDDNGPGRRTGLYALEDIDEISIIAVPGITHQDVQNAMIDQCVRLKYRFAILDPEYSKPTSSDDSVRPIDDVEAQRLLYDTHYAALYFPKVVNFDPNLASPPGSTKVLPPSGHIAGIYARVDDTRGVYKAPANEVILGISDLDLIINKGEQDILNPPPYQINVLRNFRHQGRGLRVWGARCITSDAQWKYVNVRRLFIFIEASLDQGLQWVVFEPNAQPLWDRVTQSITNFLISVWRDGALMGAKPEEAFFVKVGYSTMTQDDIDNGRLIILVGIAPVKPAEFVIIRLSQYTFTASTTGQ